MGGAAAFEGLSALLENSLVRPNAPPSDGNGSESRFTMLETIRAYGLERLEESGEGEEIRERHADYFVALAERATPELEGGGQVAWLDRLESEHDNLRAALAWLLEHGRPQQTARLGSAIWPTISQLEGDEERTTTVLRESVALSSALRDNWALVYGLVGLAGRTARHGQPTRAARLFGAAEAMGEAASVTIAFPPRGPSTSRIWQPSKRS